MAKCRVTPWFALAESAISCRCSQQMFGPVTHYIRLQGGLSGSKNMPETWHDVIDLRMARYVPDFFKCQIDTYDDAERIASPRIYWSGSPATLRVTISSSECAEGGMRPGEGLSACFIHLNST